MNILKKYPTSVMNNKRLGYLMVFPASILFLLIIIYPFLNGIMLSFKNYVIIRPNDIRFVGLDNYIKLFTSDAIFKKSLSFTFIYTISVVVLSYGLGLILALMLRRDLKFKGLLRTLVLIPWVIPPVVATTNFIWVLNDQMGIINTTLMNWQLISKPILFLADQDLVRVTVIMAAVWRNYPFMMIVILAGLQGIPRELYEAADIDGANAFQSFYHITIQMLKPVTLVCTTLMFIWTYNNFDNIFLLTRGGPLERTFVLPIYTYFTAFFRNKMSYAAAISVSMLLIMFIVKELYTRLMTMERGNVKKTKIR